MYWSDLGSVACDLCLHLVSQHLSLVSLVRMQDRSMVGVVVGSNDTAEHQDNVNDGWNVVKGIEAYGTYSACLIEV